MTRKEIEARILNIEKSLIALATRQTNRDNNAEINIVSGSVKLAEHGEQIEELAGTSELVEETLDSVLAEELPFHTVTIAELEETIDYIMTEVLPGLMA